jgi:hypothetical protein
MATAKKAVKKVAKKSVEPEVNPKFNEFGVCIDCQGGNPDCLHNNLVQTNQGTFCNLCGFKVCL